MSDSTSNAVPASSPGRSPSPTEAATSSAVHHVALDIAPGGLDADVTVSKRTGVAFQTGAISPAPTHQSKPSLTRAQTSQAEQLAQVARQNRAAWQRAKTKRRLTDEVDVDDIAAYFPDFAGASPSPPRPEVGAPSSPTAASGNASANDAAAALLPHQHRALRASPTQQTAEETIDWDAIPTRPAAQSVSFLTSSEQSRMRQLPPEFKGAAKLTMPSYIVGPISNVTLPSRLDLLGNRGFKILGAFFSRRVGNAVLGWAPVLQPSWSTKEWRIRKQLFLLPFIFSKSMARIMLFLRAVFVALVVIFILDISDAVDANPGRVWPIGIFLALLVMFKQSRFRKAPDGVMSFCRSMGAPEVEEYMFSYCWKVEPETVRTLAKAVWTAGVGVWIDVVKLCPGDEIRPMVRTTVKRVHKVVVFLCDEYCQSPNCCIEMMEAMQHPEKTTICIIKPNIHPNIMTFLEDLTSEGLRICNGFDELFQLLNLDLQDQTDISAFHWWRHQNISGAGVPDSLVPADWPMAKCSWMRGRWLLPEKSLDVGPIFLSGDCKVTGDRLAPPWLLFVALAGVGINAYDMAAKYVHDNLLHSVIDWVFLSVILACTCAPFIGFNYLLDRRRDCHVALRPLLASRSMGRDGIKVRVIGDAEDPIYIALRAFLSSIGHLAPDLPTDGAPSKKREARCVTVFVMESMARRDAMFGPASVNKKMFDNRFSLFIWSGFREKPRTIPFTDDETGQRLMRYLVLVCDWEKHSLAESLFSAIGVRVVDILHEKPSNAAGSQHAGAGVMPSAVTSQAAAGTTTPAQRALLERASRAGSFVLNTGARNSIIRNSMIRRSIVHGMDGAPTTPNDVFPVRESERDTEADGVNAHDREESTIALTQLTPRTPHNQSARARASTDE